MPELMTGEEASQSKGLEGEDRLVGGEMQRNTTVQKTAFMQ